LEEALEPKSRGKRVRALLEYLEPVSPDKEEFLAY
jgi:hypothetical protein